MTNSSIVTITDRARGILAFDAELAQLRSRIESELDQHARTIAEEDARHAHAMDVLRAQQQAIEQAIFRLGAN